MVLPSRRSGRLSLYYSPADILPSFFQTIHSDVTASLCWERMTLRGLESFVYHDRIFKQRYGYCITVFRGLSLVSICAKTRYHPHQLVCSTVLKLREELNILKQIQPNDLELLSTKTATLEQGFRILDEVVRSTYCSQDDQLPTIELSSPPPPCSFCGGELFRAIFRCTNSCVRDDATAGPQDSEILICDLCFIDGHACRCGSMEPYRLQPLAGLVELRTSIVNILGLTDDDGLGQP